MKESPEHGPADEPPRRRRLGFALIALAVAGAAGAWASWVSPRRESPRSAVATAHRDARPGIRYVGDAACVRCHPEIAATYRAHPMGRSLSPIVAAPPEARGEEGARDLFEAQGFRYAVERRGERTFHREARKDARGRVVAQVEGEVRYVLGSGTRARAFVIERDGYLFQSPITWYAQGRRWDLAPGYVAKNAHLERPITADCLFCHANQVEHVAGTTNRFRPPTFRGHAIGCERCHGPGERHVQQPGRRADGRDPTIVNPRHLEPALREGVCQQCHLLGEATVTQRPGRDLWDYRPGLPLHRYETVFVRPAGMDRDHPNSDHVEQMSRSACFRASRGALGCISCHDPHELPAPEQKVAYYRDRCLDCHAERGCSLPPAERRAHSPEDNCIECHMPRAATTDVPHVSTTLHSIPRRRDEDGARPSGGTPARPDDTQLVPFHRAAMSPAERAAARRDLGLVLQPRGARGAAEALPLLQEALAAHPGDLPAREAQGYALEALGRGAEGLAEFEAALSRAPDRESALVGAAILAGRVPDRDRAVAFWRRAIVVDPWNSNYHAGLARHLAQGRQWAEAAAACRRALHLNPAHIPARLELVQCLLRMGSADQARAEFATLLEFDPPDRAGLVRWFNSLR